MKFLFFILVGFVLFASLASAGIGISTNQVSKAIAEGAEGCITYGIYNPFPEDTYVSIQLSPELKDFVQTGESSSTLIPANTKSGFALPIEFCLRAPEDIFGDEKECIFGMFCEQKCSEPFQEFSGEVLVKEAAGGFSSGGGSTTSLTLSSDLNLKVLCSPQERSFVLLYVFLAVVSGAALAVLLFLRFRNVRGAQ